MNSMKAYNKMLGAVAMTYHNPVLVSVGANDGITADRVIPFCVRNQWKSILIEPLPHMMSACKKNLQSYARNNRNIYFCQCAASSSSGMIKIRYIDESIPINDIDKRHEMGKASASESYEYSKEEMPYVKNIMVPSRKLDDIISDKVDRVTVLSIDVEGYEPYVFSGFSVEKWKPKIIIWEKKHLSKDERRPIIRRLSKIGYGHKEYGPDFISALEGLEKMIDGS